MHKPNIKFKSGKVLIGFVIFILVSVSSVSGQPHLTVTASPTNVNVGDVVVVTVGIENANNLFSYEMDVKFDDSILSPDYQYSGGSCVVAGNIVHEWMFMNGSSKGTPGSLRQVGGARTPNSGGFIGSGNLFSVGFVAKAAGTSTIRLDGISLFNPSGAKLTGYTTGTASVTVGVAGCTSNSDCNDENPCTTDLCSAGECSHADNNNACDDGLYCTVNDRCSGGACEGGGARDCSSFGNQCNNGVCNENANSCQAQPKADGTQCDDGLFCWDNSICQNGVCQQGTVQHDCRDVNLNNGLYIACTIDSCDDDNDRCVHEPSNGNCNDDNICTTDTCVGNVGCVNSPVNDYETGGSCNTGQPGICASGSYWCRNGARVCEGSNPPVAEVCDGWDNDCDGSTDESLSRSCYSGPSGTVGIGVCKAGTQTCSSGSWGSCVGQVVPSQEVCTGGLDDDCDGKTDGNDEECWSCTGPSDCTSLSDQCNTGVCNAQHICEAQPKPQGTGCNDNGACTNNDVCTNGVCGGSIITCNDNNVCTTDSCNPASGCVYTPNTASCNDNDACTQNDRCSNRVCSGTAITCNDNNVCTTDSCNPASGCVYTPNTDLCDDSNVCTQNDRCSNRVCSGTAVSCPAAGTCDGATGYRWTGICSITQGCTKELAPDEVCGNGKDDDCDGKTDGKDEECWGCAGPSECTSLNDQCNTGVCNAQHICEAQPKPQGTGCNDNGACTNNDVCTNGVCGGSIITCNDNNVCTTDSCNPASGCVYTPNTASCNDNDACTQNDRCSGGTCRGVAISCPAAGTCADVPGYVWTGSCSPVEGCTKESITADEICDNGVDDDCDWKTDAEDEECWGCQSDGDCASFNTNCMEGFCSPQHTCETKFRQDGTACGDNNVCTNNDVCTGGVCGGTVIMCNDNNVCTTDSCNSASGCEYTSNTASCDDGNVCTENDVCSSGSCQSGSPKTCLAAGTCYGITGYVWTGSCDYADGCTTELAPEEVCGNQKDDDCDGDVDGYDTECLMILSITPATHTVNVGDRVDVTIEISNVPSLFSYEMDVKFDDSILSPDYQYSGGSCVVAESFLGGLMFMNGSSKDTLGIIRQIASMRTPKSGGVSGSGALFSVGFIAKAAGTSTLSLSGISLYASESSTDMIISDSLNDATITVLGEPPECTKDGDCDDGKSCTTDSCSAGKCSHADNNNVCDDGLYCTVNDRCSGGACVGGGAKECSDGVQCTIDTCNEGIDDCEHDASNCQCSNRNDPICDDGNPCTTDQCNMQTRTCENPNVRDGTRCVDDEFCTIDERCIQGLCIKSPFDCSDGVDCTVDTCNEKTDSCEYDLSGCDCDRDEDVYESPLCDGDDCNDNDPNIHPRAVEVPGDGIDQDCDGKDPTPNKDCKDKDGDGYFEYDMKKCSEGNDMCDNPRNIFSVDRPDLTPNFEGFDIFTELTNMDLWQEGRGVENFHIGINGEGEIMFLEPVPLVKLDTDGCLKKMDIHRYIRITKNEIEVKSNLLRDLDKPAILTFSGVELKNPIIYKDGEVCDPEECIIQEFVDGNLIVRVPHFTLYSLGEAPSCGGGRISSPCVCGGAVRYSGSCCSDGYYSGSCPSGKDRDSRRWSSQTSVIFPSLTTPGPTGGPGETGPEEKRRLVASILGTPEEGKEFTVLVLDELGNPVQGTTVKYFSSEKRTGADGKANFVGTSGPAQITVEKEGFESTVVWVTVKQKPVEEPGTTTTTEPTGEGQPWGDVLVIISIVTLIFVAVAVYMAVRFFRAK